MSRNLAYILPGALLLAMAGCWRGDFLSKESKTPDIRDVTSIKQDCLAHVDPAAADKPLIEPAQHARLNEAFRQQWLRPWEPGCNPPKVEDVRKAFTDVEARPGYAENLLPHPASFAQRLGVAARLTDYPNCAVKAIATRNTNLRKLPTMRPRFEQVSGAGEGFPFDTLQDSALWAGTPLLLCHASADGEWAFVDSPCGSGWVLRQDVAAMDEASVRRYQEARLVAATRDHVPVADAATGAFLFSAHIGAVFPLAADRPGELEILTAARDVEGAAVLRRAVLTKRQAAVIPLAPTPANIAAMANEMLGEPYDWGGQFEGRDCSATTRDLMAPFGVWLPRNSSDQAGAYRDYSLKDLSGPEKEHHILEKGVPFLTLIRLPGHIALYIGSAGGRAIILHSFWGIRTRHNGVEGRKIVGRCVITTLRPGMELPDLDQSRDCWDRIESMVFIGEEKDRVPSAR